MDKSYNRHEPVEKDVRFRNTVTVRQYHKAREDKAFQRRQLMIPRIWISTWNKEGIAGILCLKELEVGRRKLELQPLESKIKYLTSRIRCPEPSFQFDETKSNSI